MLDFLQSKTPRRLKASRHFDLQEILENYDVSDLRDQELRPGDIIELKSGCFHVEIPDLKRLYLDYARDNLPNYDGIYRAKAVMKFVNKFVFEKSKKFDYKEYMGKILDLPGVFNNKGASFYEAAIFLSLCLNQDEHLRRERFTVSCVCGPSIAYGKITDREALVVKLSNLTSGTYILNPADDSVTAVHTHYLRASEYLDSVQAYETEDGSVIMLGVHSNLFRPKDKRAL